MAYSFGVLEGGAFDLQTELETLGWELVKTSPSGDSSGIVAKSVEHGIATDGTGEYIDTSERTYNQKTDLSDEYVSASNEITAHDVAEIFGACDSMIGSVTAKQITEIEITTTNTGDQRAKLIIRGHLHGEGSLAHTANKTFPDFAAKVTGLGFDGYGATDFIPCGFGEFDVTGSTLAIRIGHKDAQGSDGDFLAGRSQGVMIETSTTATSDDEPETTTQGDGTQVIGAVGTNAWTFESAVRKRGAEFGTWMVKAHLYLPASTGS